MEQLEILNLKIKKGISKTPKFLYMEKGIFEGLKFLYMVEKIERYYLQNLEI
jgi:hypothetical protein